MSKAMIGVGAALIILAIAALILAGGDDAPTKTQQTAPPTHAPTSDEVYNTIKPTETPEPVEEYVDVGLGLYGNGDRISYLGKEGVLAGTIEDGEVISSTMFLKDEQNQIVLRYQQSDHPDHGHVELISYPQDGYVLLEIDGKDSGYKFKYGSTIEQYLITMENPNDSGNAFWILEN